MIDWKAVAYKLHQIADYYFCSRMDSSIYDEELEGMFAEYLDHVRNLKTDAID